MSKIGEQTQSHKIFSGMHGRGVSKQWEERSRKSGLRQAIKRKSEILGRWVTSKEVMEITGMKKGKFEQLLYKCGKTIDEILLSYGVTNESG